MKNKIWSTNAFNNLSDKNHSYYIKIYLVFCVIKKLIYILRDVKNKLYGET